MNVQRSQWQYIYNIINQWKPQSDDELNAIKSPSTPLHRLLSAKSSETFQFDLDEKKYPSPENQINDLYTIVFDDDNDITIPRIIESENIEYPLPKAIFSSIWSRSDDEKFELLIDSALVKVLNSDVWYHEDFISSIFTDAKFFDAVETIYDECGQHEFFENFIKENDMREIKILKIEKEQKSRIIKNNSEIFNILLNMDFSELDKNQDEKIIFEEFEQAFKSKEVIIEEHTLLGLFNNIDSNNDGWISSNELKKWKESVRIEHFNVNNINSELQIWYVYWYKNSKKYKFTQYEMDRHSLDIIEVAKLQHYVYEYNENTQFKWAVYVPKLPREQRQKFRKYHLKKHLNGYWQIINSVNHKITKKKKQNIKPRLN
eukprot:549159_1